MKIYLYYILTFSPFYATAMELSNNPWLKIIARSNSATKKSLKQTCRTLCTLTSKNNLQLYFQSPLNLTAEQGDYALSFCAYHNCLPAMQNLLKQRFWAHYVYSGISTEPLNIAYHNHNQEMITLLEKHNAYHNTHHASLLYPLAAFVGDYETLQKYVNSPQYKPFYENYDPRYGKTSLLYPAIVRGHTKIVELLLSHKKTIKHISTGEKGTHPLSIALSVGNAFIAERLLTIPSVRLNGLPKHINNHLCHCAQHGYLDCAALLVQLDPTCINTIAFLHSVKNIEAGEGKMDDFYIFFAYMPALTIATLYGHYEVVKFLLRQKNIDCNIGVKNYSTYRKPEKGLTPLYVAALQGHKKIVKLLLRCPTINPCLYMGPYTPLHIACKRGHYTIVKFLVRHSPSLVTMQTQDGHKLLPLDLAQMGQKRKIIRFLETQR